jgi:hypothetical protein
MDSRLMRFRNFDLTSALALAFLFSACSPSVDIDNPDGPSGAGAATTGGTGGTTSVTPMPTATVEPPIIDPGGTGGTGGGSTGNGCGESSFETDLLPTNILFIVDRSGSMNCTLDTPRDECEDNPPDTPQPGSRWEAILGAMQTALADLAQVPNTSVGLSYFSNDDICGVNSLPSVGVNPLTQPQLEALLANLEATEPRGGTPLVGSVVLGYKYLHEVAQAPGNRFVVLVTDGEDSCLDRYDASIADPIGQLINVELPKAMSVNIRTFALGAPGSEPARALLSQIAFAGGTARSETCDRSGSAPDVGDCHFDMTTSTDFAADFAAALDEITGRAALTCEFALPEGQGADSSKTNVSYFAGGTTEVELGLDEACVQPDIGWRFVLDDAGQITNRIELCPAACDTLRADPSGRIDVELGCETRIIR